MITPRVSSLLLRRSLIRHASVSSERIKSHRRLPFYGAAATAVFLGFTVTQLYISSTRQPAVDAVPGPKTQDELTEIYDKTASSFDAEVNISERLMGVTSARRKMVAQARGHVLEVSCGTARNLGYYRFGDEIGGVRSLTLADLSIEMVQQGKLKWHALRGGNGLQGKLDGVPVRFWHGDVKGLMPPPPVDSTTGKQAAGYDTIVQSMGLCSTDEPVQLLQNLASYLDPGNAEARILLLEHGRSYVKWWNGVLDSQAAMHASKHGCWWNRDIGDIVAASGLEVVRERRQNFGTTWIYELKRRPGIVYEQRNDAVASNRTEAVAGSWSDWLPRWTYEKICKR